MIFDLFLENPLIGLIVLASVIEAIAIHEAAHAFTANYLGDNTPKLQGRLTLNPLAHLDPFGTLLIIFAGIGWGKPVVFNPFNLRHFRRDTALIALAGPVSNIVLAIFVALLLWLIPGNSFTFFHVIGRNFIILNVALAVFNMIPIEPLDGFKVVAGALPPYLAFQWEETRKYGFVVLIILLLTGGVEKIVLPMVNVIAGLIIMLI